MASDNKSFDAIPRKKFPKGEIIVHQEKKPAGIYFLTHGKVNVIIDGEIISEINQMGSILGEMAYFLDNVSSATIQCAEDSEFLYIENPKEFFRNNPEVIYNITKTMCSRILNLSKQVAMLKNKSADNNAEPTEAVIRKEAMSVEAMLDHDDNFVVF
jgi:CRP-like cAMP-binding protein